MKERITKTLIVTMYLPYLLVTVLISPIVAFIYPDKVKLGEDE